MLDFFSSVLFKTASDKQKNVLLVQVDFFFTVK